MSIPVIVMGPTGRMGSTLVRLIREDRQLVLAGGVDVAERIKEAESLGCPLASEPGPLLEQTPGAVIVDFTSPAASLATAKSAVLHGAAHVIGTTGFSGEQKAELEVLAQKTPLFLAPNMSVGINVLLSILPELSRLLGPDYDMEIMEIHHNKKKDSPSGTALRLGESLASSRNWSLEETACYHREGIIGERPEKEIGMQTIRGGDVVGVHTVYFLGPGERIEVTHQAHSRENFAMGALRAARWLHGKNPGKLYSMQDVLFHESGDSSE